MASASNGSEVKLGLEEEDPAAGTADPLPERPAENAEKLAGDVRMPKARAGRREEISVDQLRNQMIGCIDPSWYAAFGRNRAVTRKNATSVLA